MFDSHKDNPPVVDFDEMADQLLEQGHSVSPAQLHGCLSAVLATGATAEAEHGPVVITQALDIDVHGELADQVMTLYRVTADALVDDEFGFHPLLPDDDVELPIRVTALAQWCDGFMAGFALAGSRGEALAGDTQEILQDIAAMVDAEVDEQASEEESESSYFELVEYLRFSVLNVHAQLDEAAAPGKPGRDEPLH